jgi:hypothetical protein
MSQDMRTKAMQMQNKNKEIESEVLRKGIKSKVLRKLKQPLKIEGKDIPKATSFKGNQHTEVTAPHGANTKS